MTMLHGTIATGCPEHDRDCMMTIRLNVDGIERFDVVAYSDKGDQFRIETVHELAELALKGTRHQIRRIMVTGDDVWIHTDTTSGDAA